MNLQMNRGINIKMKNIIKILSSVALVLALGSFFIVDDSVSSSLLIGYFTSSLIMMASMKSYQTFVERSVSMGLIPDDERDTIDKVEDPYMLFDDEEIDESKDKDLVEVVKEERAKLKGNGRSFLDVLKDSKTSLSPYRLLAYVSMIMGFIYLQKNEILDIKTYLISISIPMIVVIISLIWISNDNKES